MWQIYGYNYAEFQASRQFNGGPGRKRFIFIEIADSFWLDSSGKMMLGYLLSLLGICNEVGWDVGLTAT